jgi:hypothetical protein
MQDIGPNIRRTSAPAVTQKHTSQRDVGILLAFEKSVVYESGLRVEELTSSLQAGWSSELQPHVRSGQLEDLAHGARKACICRLGHVL